MPRSDGLTLGGTSEGGEWSMEPDEEAIKRVALGIRRAPGTVLGLWAHHSRYGAGDERPRWRTFPPLPPRPASWWGEIYFTSFPDAMGKWQISNAGGVQPRWSGRRRGVFFYLDSGGRMTAVTVAPQGSALTVVQSTTLFLTRNSRGSRSSNVSRGSYDVSSDGKRFLLNRYSTFEGSSFDQVHVVLDWLDELARIVPVP